MGIEQQTGRRRGPAGQQVGLRAVASPPTGLGVACPHVLCYEVGQVGGREG